MSLSRRRFSQSLLTALAAGLLPPVGVAKPVDARPWRAISPPQPGQSADKIEVVEFFSYGCPHCHEIHPLISAWAARLPEDVVLVRVPVTFGRAAWADLARLYYALEATGNLARLDQAVFTAIHAQRTPLFTKDRILDWIERQGVDPKTFEAAFDSFAVETRVKRSDQLVRRYQVDGVPLITVDGRYAVVTQGIKDYTKLLAIANDLIEQARARRKEEAATPPQAPDVKG